MNVLKATLALGMLLFGSTFLYANTTPVDAKFFGLHVLYADKAYADGERSSWPFVRFGSWRVWNSFVSWNELQAAPNQWDFTRLDRYVAWAEKANVEVVYTLGRTPQWAFARPNARCDGKYNCAAEPPDHVLWEAYVRTLASRYKGRIAAYEVWNEPAFSEVDPLYRPDGRPIQYFAGSANQMAEMARIAYQTIKSVDPMAVVVSPGVTSEGNGLRRLETFLKAGGGQWADAIAFHLYVSAPEESYSQVLQVRELLTKYGIAHKPIWNTEMGFVYAKAEFGVTPGNKTGRWTDILDQQTGAAYLARSLVLQAGADVKRVHWFNWDGDPPHPTMGIAAKRGRGKTPMTIAFAKVQSWLQGATDVSCSANAQSVWTCTIRINGSTQWIVWGAKAASSIDLYKLGDGTFLVDRLLSDNIVQVRGTDSLPVGNSPILLHRN